MMTVKAAGSSQPLRWRRRDDDQAGGGRRADAASFQDALAALPVPVRRERIVEHRPARTRPAASFIAQLLANRMNLAAIPRRRRGEREEVDARYTAADPAARPTATGSLVRRDA